MIRVPQVVLGERKVSCACVSRITCEIDVRRVGAFCILLAFGAIAQDHPAAVLPGVGSRGRRQDQLAVPVALPNAAGRKRT